MKKYCKEENLRREEKAKRKLKKHWREVIKGTMKGIIIEKKLVEIKKAEGK